MAMVEELSASTCTLILGCMFSGKTDRLIELCRSKTASGYKCVAMKPGIDTRFSEVEIVSHSAKRLLARSISNILESPIEEDADCLFIDEGQFFDNLSTFVENYLCAHPTGKHIWISALAGDAFGKPWSTISNLVPLATEIINMHGKCSKCDRESSYTARVSYATRVQLEVGGPDKYWPACPVCFWAAMQTVKQSGQT